MSDRVVLERFFCEAGGDLDAVLARLRSPERVERFVRMFAADGTYAALCGAVAAGDVDAAFRASHTLKGVSRDVGLTGLGDAASEVCEALRAGDLDAARPLMEPVDDAYGRFARAMERHLP